MTLRSAWIAGTLAALGAVVLVSSGCGGGIDERPAAAPRPLTVVCPGAAPVDVLLGGGFNLGNRTYLVRADSTSYSLLGSTSQQIPTTLTIPRIRAADEYGANKAIHIVGCRNDGQIWVTFRGTDSDGVVDDKVGEFSIDNAIHFTAMLADLEHSCVYAYDSKAKSLLKYTDTNADGLPDSSLTMVTHSESTPLIDLTGAISKEPGGTLVLAPTSRSGGMEPVSVVIDANFDGNPETVETKVHALHANVPPRFKYPPRVGDSIATAIASPGAGLEIWLVTENGVKVNSDPQVARLGTATVPTGSDSVDIGLSPPIASGSRVSLFQVSPSSGQGAVHLAEAAFPVIKGVSHTSVDGAVATVVAITGDNFHSGTQVTLTQNAPSQSLTLTPVISSATELSVTIPVLNSTWKGTSFIRVFDSNSPHRESRSPLVVYR